MEPARSALRENLTIPNGISVLRLIFIVVFAVLLITRHDAAAIAVLAAAGVSDFLDGFLARRWNQVTAWGAILDPAADRLLTVAVVVGLAWRDIIPWWLVAVLMVRDVVVGVALLWLRSKGGGGTKVTMLGKSATFGLYVSLPLAYLSFDRWESVHAAAIGLAVASAVLYWGAALQYLRQVRDASRSIDHAV